MSDANSTEKMIALLAKLGNRPVSYNRAFVEIGIGIPAAILLTQCIFWSQQRSNSNRKGWFYKTTEEWEEETGLTRDQIQLARAKLIKKKVLRHKLWGIPARSHYQVDFETLVTHLTSIPSTPADGSSSLRKTRKQGYGNPANKIAANPQRNSETTSETTDKQKKKKASLPTKSSNSSFEQGEDPKPPRPFTQEELDDFCRREGLVHEDTRKFIEAWLRSNDRKGWRDIHDWGAALRSYVQRSAYREQVYFRKDGHRRPRPMSDNLREIVETAAKEQAERERQRQLEQQDDTDTSG
jgi:hypothetical protein